MTDATPPVLPPHQAVVALAETLRARGHRASVAWGVEVQVVVSTTRRVRVRCDADDEADVVVLYNVHLDERAPPSVSHGVTRSVDDVEAGARCWGEGSTLAEVETRVPFLGRERRLLERVSRELPPEVRRDAGYASLSLRGTRRSARVLAAEGLVRCVLDLPDGRVAIPPASTDVVPLLRAWLADARPTEVIVQEMAGVEIRALSEHRWVELLRKTREPGSHHRDLRALVAALVEDPLVVRFYPFTSHATLCFSASSEYPFVVRGLPAVSTAGTDVFRFELRPCDGVLEDLRPPVDPMPRTFGSTAAVIEAVRDVLASYPVTPFVGSATDLVSRGTPPR